MTPDEFVIPKYPVVKTMQGYKRAVVIGDIHGCLEEFLELVKKVGLGPQDAVVLTGDLLDRGPAGPETVAMARAFCRLFQGYNAVLGNHDEKHVRYRRHLVKKRETPEYPIPMKECPGGENGAVLSYQPEEQHRSMTDEDVAWLAQRPTAVVFPRKNHPDVVVTHAGLIAGRGFAQQTKGLIRNRWLNPTTLQPVKSTTDEHGRFTRPPGAVGWEQVWAGPGVVVHGHVVRSLSTPYNHKYAVGVDTGCCFGGHLTALVYELDSDRRDFVQVKARYTYCERKPGYVNP